MIFISKINQQMNINGDISTHMELPNHSKIALTKQEFEKECVELIKI